VCMLSCLPSGRHRHHRRRLYSCTNLYLCNVPYIHSSTTSKSYSSFLLCLLSRLSLPLASGVWVSLFVPLVYH
jgi:hypothetical protein